LRLSHEFPDRVLHYPQIRFMGSKFRLLPWLHEVLSELHFRTALDAFSGSGCVSYLLKCMGKEVHANDFLNFCSVLAHATIENPGVQLAAGDLEFLLAYDPRHRHFIERTFSGIFFTPDDLRFLDQIWWNINRLRNPYKRSMAIAALIRSCAKRQPRGVFTVAGDPEHYKDGRRDLGLSLRQHFTEHVAAYNAAVFDNGMRSRVTRSAAFDIDAGLVDLVYLDPPYVPRADDNCYVKRYHFLEGLSCYWEGQEILPNSKVRKLKKPFTPFSYRHAAVEAFERLFTQFSRSIVVLSYSSNGFPDLDVLVALMRRHKAHVEVFQKAHRYHFGTHAAAERNEVREYLIVGR
jgi:DNA adenine methylase/adenine-specific DNA-methyltransferase